MKGRAANKQRRRFLQAAAVAAAGASCTARRSPWRVLSPEEAETAAALCERIIPPDDYPGAAWAGAVIYIDRQLAGPLKRARKNYHQGLAGVDQSSQEMFGRKFSALQPDQQVEVMKRLEKGEAPGEIWKSASAREFFNMVVAHTMQSFYGDPRHGGNRDAVAWKMLGIPLSPVRGREQHDLTRAVVPGREGRS